MNFGDAPAGQDLAAWKNSSPNAKFVTVQVVVRAPAQWDLKNFSSQKVNSADARSAAVRVPARWDSSEWMGLCSSKLNSAHCPAQA